MPVMNISEAKLTLSKAIKLLDLLKTTPLETPETAQAELAATLALFTPDVLEDLKRKLHKRRRRRKREARFRKTASNDRAERLKTIQRNNKEVERMFRQGIEEAERFKTEESVRRQADVVLQTVRRYAGEGRRVLSLLTALSKLRAARCQQDAAAGATPSVSVTEAFETALGRLRGFWERQLEDYGKEETGLKIMLGEGSESRLGKSERELVSILRDWEKALFGEEAAMNMPWHEQLEARRQWDQYVVAPDMPLSSAMPLGWLLPQPLNQHWEQYVSHY